MTSGQSLKDAYYFEDNVKYTNNFFVTDLGLGFHYNVYEIASFASGATTVFVPFHQLKDCLNPQFEALIFKNGATSQ